MKVLVTGATGQLGWDVVKELKRRNIECRGTGSKELDITDKEAVLARKSWILPIKKRSLHTSVNIGRMRSSTARPIRR